MNLPPGCEFFEPVGGGNANAFFPFLHFFLVLTKFAAFCIFFAFFEGFLTLEVNLILILKSEFRSWGTFLILH